MGRRSQFETQLGRWESAKNVKKSEWKLILAQIDQIKSHDVKVRVRFSGQIISDAKIKRARRYIGAGVDNFSVSRPTC